MSMRRSEFNKRFAENDEREKEEEIEKRKTSENWIKI